MRLLIDEMYPWQIAHQLRERGHDAISVTEQNHLVHQRDALIFAAAQSEGRAVVTENIVDFSRLAAIELERRHSHAGVIYTTERSFFRGNSRAIGQMVRALDALLQSEVEIEGREIWLRPV